MDELWPLEDAVTVIVSNSGALGVQGLKDPDVLSQVEGESKAAGVSEASQYWTELTTAV